MMKKTVALLLLLCLALSGCGRAEPTETTAPTEFTTAPEETAVPVDYPVPTPEEMPGNDSGADWGLTLTAENVNAMGCTIRYTQSGGAPTGELNTGSYFSLEVYNGEWKEAEMLTHDHEIAWNSIAYLIAMDTETELAEDWSFLYGPLQPGWYRIGKEVMDFRGPGDYDIAVFYAYIEITK